MEIKCLLAGVGLICLCGCVRVATTTKLKADGSFVRTSIYSLAKGSLGQKKEPSFHSTFVLPDSKAAAPLPQTEDKDERHLTVKSSGQAGADSRAGDITVLSDSGKPLLTSHVSAKKLLGGEIEYTETINWVGPKKPIDTQAVQSLVDLLKPKLPSQDRDPRKLEELAVRLQKQMVKYLCGPPIPELAEALTNADLARMRLTDAIAENFTADLKSSFPDLSPAQIQAELALIENFDARTLKDADVKGDGQGPSDTNGLTSFLFVLEFPGKLIQTNGLQSRTGKVYWSFYSLAAMYDTVSLKAVIDPN